MGPGAVLAGVSEGKRLLWKLGADGMITLE